ncbi:MULTISPECIES: sigma-54 dependent transcriptional regulator [Idiomarina]|jgi:DNA-binding NtrC family response regulator|uniref:sigma-54-dependent transcriptional regulator n=1 Tax=Idiomarina TaxID=135575 RepID=UPI000C09144D|nr:MULTISPECIES: sigma-54 dependent transcriptional regulator [Idiomarina]MAC35605.1 sigma-54-dependent Fis family transcriptional regulator [Haliea sp.]MAO67917.1 sigma-54-dependent Fis family transcriptional regulator [Idiomarina sp.]MBF79659.1 sigma-54-dependent Fis family transcriptional regulator [Idiomarina sp.]|tara:strand:- start:16602 stop:17993 length:1392 start_codon:yes stop_codon:yes gene_type:complete
MLKRLEDARLLIVDDNEDILLASKILLKQHGAKVDSLTGPDELEAKLSDGNYDLVLLDMNFTRDARSGEEGLEALKLIRAQNTSAAVVVMTAYGSLALAVEAMKEGANDFIVKPWQNERLITTVANSINSSKQVKEIRRLEGTNNELTASTQANLNEMIGSSGDIVAVKNVISRVGVTDASVLLTGESGSGKEVAARSIHAVSDRKDEPFVSIDMGAIPDELFESEVFGHKKGAFTGAQSDRLGRFLAAGNGTLFLDEIGNLPLASQVKLLRVLQTRQVTPVGGKESVPLNARIIAATNDDLSQKVAVGDFRQDLLYRINTVEIRLPPLRSRKSDIDLLAEYFLGIYRKKYQRPDIVFSQESKAAMRDWSWPGNVRELQHVVERAVIMCGSQEIRPQDLFASPSFQNSEAVSHEFKTLNLHRLEKEAIQHAMKVNEGNITKAASDLGLNRTSLYRRLEKHGLH